MKLRSSHFETERLVALQPFERCARILQSWLVLADLRDAVVQYLLRDDAVSPQALIPLQVSSGLRELRLDGVDVGALCVEFDGLSGLELPDSDFGFFNERAAVRGFGAQSCPGVLELARCVIALLLPLLVRGEVNQGIAGVDCLAFDDPDRSDAIIRCSADSNDFAFRFEPSPRRHGPACARRGAGRGLTRIDAGRGATGDKRVHGRENQNTHDHDGRRA